MAEIEFDCEEPATGADPATDAFIRESFEAVDTEVLTRLVEHAFKRMHLADDTYLSIAIVNEDEMERVHIEWMDLPGATDVMSFPHGRAGTGNPRKPLQRHARRHHPLPTRRRTSGRRRGPQHPR